MAATVIRYAAGRVLFGVVAVWVAATLAFLLAHLAPGGPAIGLGGVFLHLNAELNFFRLIEDEMADYATATVAARQAAALARVGLSS